MLALGQAEPMSERAAEALRAGQTAAAQALNTYTNHYPDQPLWRDAIRHGEEARRLAPGRPEPLRFLGQAYSATRWYGRAYNAWMNFLDAGGELDAHARIQLADASAWLGFNAYSSRNYQQALSYYQQAHELNPNDAEVIGWLGRTYYETGNPQEAIPLLEQARERFPSVEEYPFFLERAQHQLRFGVEASNAFFQGVEAYRQKRYSEAFAAFRRAIQHNQNFSEAFVYAGTVTLELRQPETAILYWERAVALNPQDDHSRHFLALAQAQTRWGIEAANAFFEGVRLYESNNRQAAQRAFQRAINLNSQYAEAWAWLGRTAYEAQDYPAAETAYARANSLEPGNETYQYFLGEARRLAKPPEVVVEAPAPAPELTPEPEPVQPAEVASAPVPQAEPQGPPEPEVPSQSAVEPEPREPEPPVQEIEAPQVAQEPEAPAAPTGGPPLLLIDVTMTHDVRDENSASAFSFLNSTSNVGIDLESPVGYASGTLVHRLEVISKPSDLPVQYQLCLVPANIAQNPACSNATGLQFTAPGTYEYRQPMTSLSNHAGINWKRGLQNLMLVVKDGAGNPIDTSFALKDAWAGSPELSLYYPMQVRYTATIIP